MRKPMPEFVVAPKIVIASPIVGTTIAIAHAITRIDVVQIKFYLKLNYNLDSPMINSSMESFEGSTQNGAAKRTTVSMRS